MSDAYLRTCALVFLAVILQRKGETLLSSIHSCTLKHGYLCTSVSAPVLVAHPLRFIEKTKQENKLLYKSCTWDI